MRTANRTLAEEREHTLIDERHAARAASAESWIYLDAGARAVSVDHRGAGAIVQRARLLRARECDRSRDHRARSRCDRSVRGAGRGVPALASRRPHGHRQGRRNHLHRASGQAFTSVARLLGEPRVSGSLPRRHRPRRAPLLGSGRVQEARVSEAVPVASGQRLHLHRAAGLPDLLDGAQRRDARQRLPVGDSGRSLARHARASRCRSSASYAARRTVPRRSPFRSAPATSSYSRR